MTRQFLAKDFKVNHWAEIQPYYENLKNRAVNSEKDLEKWFLDRSELESVLSEELAWRYIAMTCNTADEIVQQHFETFVEEIQPKAANYTNQLNQKCLSSLYLRSLEQDFAYKVMMRSLRKQAEIFREENISLQTELQILERKYGEIVGKMTVEVDNEEITLPQATNFSESTDRAKREEVYLKIQNKRFEQHKVLDELLSQLVQKRHQMALNAGFKNFRDYQFANLGRFDYTPKHCFEFHEAVKHEIMPIIQKMAEQRKQNLGVDSLRPWDSAVNPKGLPPLKPFENSQELIEKTIRSFGRLDSFLADCIAKMQEMKHLDLDSRKNKAPGGYNYPLAETGYPFIFMNATSNFRDLTTLLHEGGHAVHSIVTKDLALNAFKEPPAEVAELASMSMELITMDTWDEFFPDTETLKRAKLEQLEDVITVLPWVATIDKFQHWLYENPFHTISERKQAWLAIFQEFSDTITDWQGLEEFRNYHWQKQLHIYEVPFYYIEYGFAQLGAIAMWKNYRQNPEKGLEGYLNALKLGYTRTIPEIYKAGNIEFNFSKNYISELVAFVNQEIEQEIENI
jgi:oligoendopeptidase F